MREGETLPPVLMLGLDSALEGCMRLTLFTLVLLLIGLLVGSLVRPIQAQPNPGPFQVGQRVSLSYADRSAECTVQEIRGECLLCAPSKQDPFKLPTYPTWYNMASTESISILTSSR
jgi:hypothetical protein